MTTLQSLIAAGETLPVEFKSDVNDNELVETVIRVANGQGDALLVGVHDDGRETAELCKLSAEQASPLLRGLAAEHSELRLEGQRRGARCVWKGLPPAPRGKKK